MRNFINEDIKGKIGYTYLMKKVYPLSGYGKKHMKKISPYTIDTVRELNEELDKVELFLNCLKKNQSFDNIMNNLQKLKDISNTINNCINSKILDTIELFEIKIQAIICQKFSNEIMQLNIPSLFLNDVSGVINILSEDSIHITPDFHIYSSYSEELYNIRAKKRKLEFDFFKADNNETRKKLQEKRSHYVILEDEEELKIRKELSIRLEGYMSLLEENSKIIGHMDFIIQKALLAYRYNGVRPIISSRKLVLKGMVNPEIKDEVLKQENVYQEVSIELESGTTLLTGANMSGKSSVLKSVILNTLLCHYGYFILAKHGEIPIFNYIRYIGQNLDNVKHGLSSFGVEITNLDETIKIMKDNYSLICLDEFARSTNPYEGQKFVKAFSEFSNNYSSVTLIATHYDGVASKDMTHLQVLGLKKDLNDMIFYNPRDVIKNIHKYMDYEIKEVSKNKIVPKDAYTLSNILNIDKDFINTLNKYYKE